MYNITITDKFEDKTVTNGYLITVGCRAFVTTDIFKALKEIEKYIKDPEKIEAEYTKKYKSNFIVSNLSCAGAVLGAEMAMKTSRELR